MSAIKELLGKEAHELTDEELADLLRGNRPRPIETKGKSKKISVDTSLDFEIDDLDFSDLSFDIEGLSLEDAEERS